MAVGRFPAEEVEYWRDAGLYYFVPCVSKGSSIAVLALGRRDNGEPLTRDDIALLDGGGRSGRHGRRERPSVSCSCT